MQFYLGTHLPNWLSFCPPPLFVSHRTLGKLRELPNATSHWALDSGGFTELNLHGRWTVSVKDYAKAVNRYVNHVGNLDFAAPQDWMCEEVVLKKTDLTVRKHQELTVSNFLELRALAPSLPFIPVLQGWTRGDYLDHIEMYEKAGVKLTTYSRVGIGSVCRRQNTLSASLTLSLLNSFGLKLHAFGFKTQGLGFASSYITSADSLAWSYNARRHPAPCPWNHDHKHCGNCYEFALNWRNNLVGTDKEM